MSTIKQIIAKLLESMGFDNKNVAIQDSDFVSAVKDSLISNKIKRDKWPMWIKSSQYNESYVEYVNTLTDLLTTRVLEESDTTKLDKVVSDLFECNPRALKNAQSLITKLSNKPVGKVIDGVALSESCFAYVPDKKNPSTWDIQILNGSGAFVESNISAILPMVGDENFASVKERYMKAKIKADVSGNGNRVFVEGYSKLTESIHDSKGKLSITIIQPGLTADELKFYPREVLAEAVSLYEGVKMFANHATNEEEATRPERDINNWVASVENVRLGAGGEILGEAILIDPEFKQKIELLDSQGKLGDMGISHSAIGEFGFEEIGGREVMVIKQILAVRSVDFVTEGNAGGVTHIL